MHRTTAAFAGLALMAALVTANMEDSHAAAHTPPASTPVIVQCVETVTGTGHESLNHCRTIGVNRAAVICARAAFLADDYAHTHTGGAAERRAVRACATQVGGF